MWLRLRRSSIVSTPLLRRCQKTSGLQNTAPEAPAVLLPKRADNALSTRLLSLYSSESLRAPRCVSPYSSFARSFHGRHGTAAACFATQATAAHQHRQSLKTAVVVGSRGVLGRALVQVLLSSSSSSSASSVDRDKQAFLNEKGESGTEQPYRFQPSSDDHYGVVAATSSEGQQNWQVFGFDVSEADTSLELQHHADWKLPTDLSPQNQACFIRSRVQSPVDAIFCVAGGFTAERPDHPNFLKTAVDMLVSSVHSSLVSTSLAATHLKDGGLLVLPGAAASLSPTSPLIGYGCAKAYIHYLVTSLGTSWQQNGLPEESKVIGIAPEMLDTPANRAAMPSADTSTWTSTRELSRQLKRWAEAPQNLQSGVIYKVATWNGQTAFAEISTPVVC